MKKVLLKDIKIGMNIAEPVSSSNGKIILNPGYYITSLDIVGKLEDAGVEYVICDETKSLDTFSFTPKIEKPVKEIHEPSPEEIAQELKEELVQAKKTFSKSTEVVKNIMTDLRFGKELKMDVVKETVSGLLDSVSKNPHALLSLTLIKDYDNYTYQHSVNVCIFATTFAQKLFHKKDVVLRISEGALLHDLGKVKIPSHIINKKSRLTNEEFDIIKKHPVYGEMLLKKQNIFDPIITEITRHHHEDYNGNGYPDKLKGKEINKYAAIVSISDFYDALTTKRSYKPAIPPQQAISILYRQAGQKFDFRLVNHFIKTIGIYPIGSRIKLASGKIAVVVGFDETELLYPLVKIIIDEQGNKVSSSKVISLVDSDDTILDEIVDLEAIDLEKIL